MTTLLGRRGTALALIGCASALASTAVPARADTRTPWHEVKQISLRSADVLMADLAAPAAADAWALGEVVSPDTVTPLVEHWNGARWRQAALPARVVHYFDATDLWTTIGAAAGGNLWAFTLNSHYLHFDGRRWTAGLLPHSGAVDIEAVEVFSRTDAWAFGGRIIGTSYSPTILPYAARFDGKTWTVVRVPGVGDISAASAISARDMYAVTGVLMSAFGRPVQARVLHWGGTAWRAMPVQPRIRRPAVLGTVLASSGGRVWIGGSTPNGTKTTAALVEHWNGRSWADASPRSPSSGADVAVLGLTPDGCGGIWALTADYSSGTDQLWHRAGGSWSAPVTARWFLSALAAVPHTTSTWGVGTVKSRGQFRGVIVLHGRAPTDVAVAARLP